MQRHAVLIASGAVLGALFAVACGGGNDKPPLTPDSEHSEHSEHTAPTTGEDASSVGEPMGASADAG